MDPRQRTVEILLVIACVVVAAWVLWVWYGPNNDIARAPDRHACSRDAWPNC
jgi:hypothetical protein